MKALCTLLLLLALGVGSALAAPAPDTARTRPAFDVTAATRAILDVPA